MSVTNEKRTVGIPLPMPYGWFHVAFSKDIGPGESKPVFYFDQDLVIFRTESGEAKVVDAYCPHMGAHLGYGIREQMGKGAKVVGDSIACPFHGWQFNGEGQCTHIPYATNMPPKIARGEAVLKAWRVREMNGSIIVWYHPHDIEPLFEPELVPELAENPDDWAEPIIHEWEIGTHMQEMGENAVDPAHFMYVHGTNDIPDAEELSFDGHTRRGFLKTRQPTPRGEIEGSIENENVGPGLSVVRFKGLIETILVATVSPVTPEITRAHYAFYQRREDVDGPIGKMGRALIANIEQQMEEDRVIWDRKKYFERPLLCDGDGPFAKFRRWYGQFLVE